MSFFKDFKEDLSTAVNEILPGEENDNYLEESAAKDEKLDELDLETFKEKLTKVEENFADVKKEEYKAPVFNEAPRFEIPRETPVNNVTDETTIITEGMTITGNLETTGSVEVRGTVNGDVRCNGKLVVTGVIIGNAQAAEFFADNAKVQGEILADGTVKVGLGSVIVGNITATSSVVAGAVKGDIDVRGPVVVDTAAIIVGNIKSRSVQINNGAIIEGFCSQCYSEVDVQNIFG